MDVAQQGIADAIAAFRTSITDGCRQRNRLSAKLKKVTTYLLPWRFFEYRSAVREWERVLSRFDEALSRLLGGSREPAITVIREEWPRMYDVTAYEAALCGVVGRSLGGTSMPGRFHDVIKGLETPPCVAVG
jgi:hypothetical protein